MPSEQAKSYVTMQTFAYKCDNGHGSINYSSRVPPEDVQVPCVHCGKHLTHVK